QRVAVARAVAGDPPLLLADEPTGNLDSAAGAEVLGVLRDLHAAGTTIAVITHDPEIAAWCPRQVRVRDGLVVGDPGAGAGCREPGPIPKTAPTLKTASTPATAPERETTDEPGAAAKGAPR
ncbi:ABC transporter ATP-binding protein, partial [Microbispora sp. NPDC049633]